MDAQYDVRDLFRNSAEAVVSTQKLLDSELGVRYLRSCEADPHRFVFNIPRAAVRLRFGVVEKSSGGWRLVPLKWFVNSETNVREQMHTHELEFFVDAGTEPPPAMGTEDPTASIPLYLSVPYFMMSATEEAEVAQMLLNALDPEKPSWTSEIPGDVSNINERVKKERERFKEALSHNDKEKGPVFFRYQTSPVSYLVVRVVGSDANDSIFVVSPESVPKAVIHSLDGDEVKTVRYQPLHRLLYTMRLWQSGSLPPIVTKDLDTKLMAGSETGLNSLIPFALNLRTGYAAGLNYLSDPTSESSMQIGGSLVTPSVYYDFTGVQATLSYSVGYKKKSGESNPLFNFALRRTWENDDPIHKDEEANETKLIESRALVKAFHHDGKARVEVELQTPEFMLSGAAHERFLKLVDKNIDAIAEEFAPDQAMYYAFIKNQAFRSQAVTLLSYRGSEPKDKFFVVWPGNYQNQSRDFAFTCALDDKDLSLLTDVKPVLRVQDDLSNLQLSTVTGDQYRSFHNFFHAVRMWRIRITTQ